MNLKELYTWNSFFCVINPQVITSFESMFQFICGRCCVKIFPIRRALRAPVSPVRSPTWKTRMNARFMAEFARRWSVPCFSLWLGLRLIDWRYSTGSTGMNQGTARRPHAQFSRQVCQRDNVAASSTPGMQTRGPHHVWHRVDCILKEVVVYR